jgi:hypothetical protein
MRQRVCRAQRPPRISPVNPFLAWLVSVTFSLVVIPLFLFLAGVPKEAQVWAIGCIAFAVGFFSLVWDKAQTR